METITYTEARKGLAKTIEQVCADHAPVIIRGKSSSPVVLLSLEDYLSLEETAYLLRSPKNAARLMEAIKEVEEGNAQEKIFCNENSV